MTLAIVRLHTRVWRYKGPSPKSLDSDENFKPQHTLFCRDIKICRNLRIFFYNLWTKKCFSFESIPVFLEQEMHYYMAYIAYCTELNDEQTCIRRQTDVFVDMIAIKVWVEHTPAKHFCLKAVQQIFWVNFKFLPKDDSKSEIVTTISYLKAKQKKQAQILVQVDALEILCNTL